MLYDKIDYHAKNTETETLPKTTNRGQLLLDRPHALESQEVEMMAILSDFGDDVKHLIASNNPFAKTPDFIWRNEFWELKSINGNSRNNITHAVQAAQTQSSSIILHIAKTKRDENSILRDVVNSFHRYRKVKQIVVIIGQKYCMIDKNLVK
jgi:hypothetical protein